MNLKVTFLVAAILGIVWAILFFFIVIAQGSGEQFIYFQF